MPRGTFQCPHPCDETLPTHASIGGPPTLAGVVLVQSPIGSLLLFCGSWCMQNFICARSLCFPQSSGKPIIKTTGLQGEIPWGFPILFVRSPGWEAWRGIQNLHNSARTSLALLFSRLLVTYPADMEFDFTVIVPLLSSCCGFFFVFGHGVSFFGVFQHPPVNGGSTASCSFGALTGGGELTSFYSAILNQNWQLCFFQQILLGLQA